MKKIDTVEVLSWIFSLALIAVMTLGINAIIKRCCVPTNTQQPTITQHPSPITLTVNHPPTPAETIFVSQRPKPVIIDTMAIVKKYFAEHIYRDTVFKTDTALLAITDTVWQNGIAGREVTLQINTAKFERPHSLGVMTSFSANHAALYGAYRYRRWMVAAGYDFPQHSPAVMAGYLYNW